MSHVSVQKRIKKLLENKVIRIQANINVTQLEYISVFVMMNTADPETQKRIFERFRNCPRVISMDAVSGRYNTIIRAMAPSMKELQCFLNSSWLKRENLSNYDVFFSTKNWKPSYLPIPIAASESLGDTKSPCGNRCSFCDEYKEGDCAGCPSTVYKNKTYSDFLPK